MKQQYGIIGFPLVHSFSRSFFTEKFRAEQLDAEYLNFEIPAITDFPQIIREHPFLRGLNVTIPYKEKAMPYLDEIDSNAQSIGAVNVVKITHDKEGKAYLKGFNADVLGFTRSIQPLLKSYHTKALILGTGGASKAIKHGLSQLGLQTTFVSRTPKEGMLSYEQLSADVMGENTVVVNCSPVGTFPKSNECPNIPYELLNSRHLLYDLVYNPGCTLFLQKGKAQGATIKNGLKMLHLQAIASWEIWQQ